MLVSKEQAEKEVEGWLDYKKIKEKKRVAYKESIDSLVESISEGTLVLKEGNVFEYKLMFPVGKEKKIEELTFKPRISVADIQDHKVGNKAGDADAMILSIIAALTGQSKHVLKSLDTEDYNVCGSIAVFFV